MPTNVKKLLTAEEVCSLLGFPSRATLYAQRYRREPPGSLAIPVGRYRALRVSAGWCDPRHVAGALRI
jgi:hypothetical protein